MLRWITQTGPERIMTEMAETVEADFRRWAAFDKTARVASHSPERRHRADAHQRRRRLRLQVRERPPANPARGLQTVTAFGVLADVHTGYPIFVAEMTLLTALRTAATSAMAARQLARPGRAGDGDDRRGHRRRSSRRWRFRAALGIRSLRVWDVDPAAMRQARAQPRAARLRGRTSPPAPPTPCAEPISITTCTADKQRASVLTDDRSRRACTSTRSAATAPARPSSTPRSCSAGRHLRGVRAPDPHRGRDPGRRGGHPR